MTSIWSEGIIKWTSMTAYLPLCSLAGVVAYWRARQGDSKNGSLPSAWYLRWCPS